MVFLAFCLPFSSLLRLVGVLKRAAGAHSVFFEHLFLIQATYESLSIDMLRFSILLSYVLGSSIAGTPRAQTDWHIDLIPILLL